jgi:hypothetical protein
MAGMRKLRQGTGSHSFIGRIQIRRDHIIHTIFYTLTYIIYIIIFILIYIII